MAQSKKELSVQEAAVLLDLSSEKILLLESEGVLHPIRKVAGISYFLRVDLERINKPHETTLEQDAQTFASALQRDFLASFSKVQRIILVLGVGILSYVLLVGIFGVLFVLSPREMAQWLGFFSVQQQSQAITSENRFSRVLGAMTSGVPSTQPSLMQIVLQPVGKVSLGVVKAMSPATYEEITHLTILDPNDVLATNEDGTISPRKTVVFSDSSRLNVADSTLIANLNSEYVQGRQPGTSIGDIAIIGGNGFIQGLTPPVEPTIDEILPTISELSVSNFSSATISQWINDSAFITASTADTLTNKTIAAGSNTITGLTNSNLTGSAGITNANLANSAITITTGNGLSGGGSVSLGSGLTVTNTGVTSLTGALNQVIVSQSTGTVSLSLPQDIAATSSPSFAHLSLTDTSNQLVLGEITTGTLTWSPTSSRTLTLPDGTDTLVGKATTDTLSNKTLTAPVINGIVTTTGLTLPAYTVAGNVTGSGLPTLSSFGTINGLTLTESADGFTLSGGTTSRELTVTGAAITIGYLIKPTNSGALTIQSNGSHSLSFDTGEASEVSIGTSSASRIFIGRSGMTTTINGTASASTVIIGGGATITKHLSGMGRFDAQTISINDCDDIGAVTVTGAVSGDSVTATPTAISGGIETLKLTWNAYVSSSDTVTIRACNTGIGLGQNPASQTWRVDVWQH